MYIKCLLNIFPEKLSTNVTLIYLVPIINQFMQKYKTHMNQNWCCIKSLQNIDMCGERFTYQSKYDNKIETICKTKQKRFY